MSNMSSIQKQLMKKMSGNVRMRNGSTIRQQLEQEIRRLYSCIQFYIDDYYNSYEPKIYQRGFRTQRAMYAEDLADIRVVNNRNRMELSIKFHDNLANHRNLFGDHTSYTPILMNWGWKSKKLEKLIGHPVEHFTRFNGIHFIERGIEDFNKINKLGIHINVKAILDGKQFYNSYY